MRRGVERRRGVECRRRVGKSERRECEEEITLSVPVSSTLLMPFFSMATQAITGTSPSSRMNASMCFFTPSSYALRGRGRVRVRWGRKRERKKGEGRERQRWGE
jgi:hypothetical protein